MHNRLLTSLIFLFLIAAGLQAQSLQPCALPSPGTTRCTQSCINCNLHDTQSRNNIFLPPGANETVCLGITLENPRWFGFIAGTANLTLQIIPSNCTGSNGLEAAVIRDCGTFALACAGGGPGGAGQPLTLTMTGLVVGQNYQLVVDGFNGDVCDFIIKEVVGNTIPPPLGAIGAIQGLNHVCPQGTVTYSVPPVSGAVSYTWTSPMGTQINGGTNVETFPAATGHTVEIKFGNVGGQICVSASNACSPAIQSCIQVSNTPIPIVDLPDEVACYENSPYEWPEAPYTTLLAPGTYTLVSTPYPSHIGCDSIVRQKIKILPWNIRTLPPIFLCPGEFYTINGIEYNQTGTYQEVLQSESTGCDSTVNFSIITIPVHAAAQVLDTITCAVTSVPLSGAGSTTGGNSVFYNWTNDAWQNISNTINATATGPDVYHLIVTNVNGGRSCRDTATVVVPGNLTPPQAHAGPPQTLSCAVTQVQLQGSGSTGPQYTYLWTAVTGGNIVSGETTFNPIVSTTGTYRLQVTDLGNGCTKNSFTTVTALSYAPPGATLSVSSSISCNNAPVNLLNTSTTSAGILNHIWTRPNGSKDTTGTVALLVVNTPGLYNVLVTNTVTGCTSTTSLEVIQDELIAVAINFKQNVSCFGANNGSLNATAIGGNGFYTYAWSNGADTAAINNLDAGTYTVTVSDTQNCVGTITSTVTEPAALNANVSATAQTTLGVDDGTATANTSGGTPVYSYIWSTGDATQTITGLAPGFYTVTVTDTKGCTNIQTANVSPVNCLIEALVQSVEVSCYGAADGSASINIVTGGTAPFTLSWSNGAVSDTINNLEPGQYAVSLVDGANCPLVANFTITGPDTLQANITTTGTSGPNISNGTAAANPIGGTGPYTYLWNNGDTSASVDSLAGGVYTATITDSHDCSVVQTVEIPVGNCGLQSDFLSIQPTCSGLSNGGATVVINGGAGPFTYAWSSGGDQATESGLTGGSYQVSLTDANGCEVIDTLLLTEPPALSVSVDSMTVTSCASAPEAMATVSATGGTGLVAFSWSDGQTGSTAVGLTAGVFNVTATDENGCINTIPVSIIAVDQEAPVIVASNVNVPLGPIGSVTLTAQNIGAVITDNCVIASVTIVPNVYQCDDLGEHVVSITVVDDAGNTSSDTITVTIVDNSSPTLVCPPNIAQCFGNTLVQYPAPTATDNCLGIGGGFNLEQGQPSGTNFPQGTTVNTYSYTDGQGNVGNCSFEVTILSQLSVTLGTVIDDNGDNHVGSIDLTVSGSLAPYAFEWKLNGQLLPDTTEDLSGIGHGQYQVFITDANGCTTQIQGIQVDSLTATDNPSLIEQVGIYPNPTSGLVSVIFPDQLIGLDAYLSVFDATGRRVKEQQSSQQKQLQLDLSGLSDGLYSILIRIEGTQTLRKLVVNK